MFNEVMDNKLATKAKDTHIVYAGYLEGVCVYIGEGRPDRYKHLNSGISNVYEANHAHFRGKQIEVKILHKGLNKEEAISLEKKTIEELKPLWNRAVFGSISAKYYFNKRMKDVFKGFIDKEGKPKGNSKSKSKQIVILNYLGSRLDNNGIVRFTPIQIYSLFKDHSLLHAFLRENEYKLSKQIFNFRKIEYGVYEATLIREVT